MKSSRVFSCGVIAAGVFGVGGVSHGTILDMRSWIDANGFSNNSASNEWQGRIGSATGALMTPGLTAWTTPGVQFSVPLIGPITSPGSDSGAAGPATFDGLWVHPGSGVDAVAVFAPQSAVDLAGVRVRSELIGNGLSGNGVRILAFLTVGGITTQIGSHAVLGGTSVEQTDDFLLPGTVTLNPGDTLAIHFNDNGSYLFDHVNFNATVIIPAPAGGLVLCGAGLACVRRRRV